MSVLMFIVNVNHCPGVLLPVLIMCPTPCPAAVFDIEKPMLTDKGCYKFMRDQKRRYLNQSHVYPITFLSGISGQSTLPTPHCFIHFFVSPLSPPFLRLCQHHSLPLGVRVAPSSSGPYNT